MVEQEETYKKKQQKQKKVDILSELAGNKVLLIEGEMGAGKSKLLRHIVDSLAMPASFTSSHLLPLYITYRDFLATHDGSIDQCIASHLREVIKELDKETTILLLVDGIDEVIDAKETSAEKLGTLVGQIEARPDAKLIMTSRPMKLVDRELDLHKSVKRYSLKALSTGNILKFIEAICRQLSLSTRLAEDIKHSQLFRQLPRNPIAAILLSNLLAQSEKELPSNLTDLYAKSLELMLGRWDIEKGLSTQKEYEAAETVCCHLAEYVITNGLSMVASHEVKEHFKNYLNERNLDIDPSKLFEKATVRSGVLAEDAEGGTIVFRHRSFAEFLYAKLLNKNKGLAIDHRAWQLYWAHTYFFYFGLKKDCPVLLEQASKLPVKSEVERWLRIVNMPQYFLAAFLTPYRVVEDNLYQLFLDAARCFMDIKTGKSKTKLSRLPEIQLLWILRYLMRHCYGFTFFKRAAEATAVKIDDSSEPNEVKAVALFFLGTVSAELGEMEPFRFLLESKKLGELPLAVSCAVECEIKMDEKIGRSPLMRKHKKQWRKLTKGNRSVHALIKNIFEEPMRRSDGKHANDDRATIEASC